MNLATIRTILAPAVAISRNPFVAARKAVPAPVTPALTPEEWAEADAICRKHTGIGGFLDLVDAKGSYRPTLFCAQVVLERLADLYDQFQEHRGDERRAYRYGRERRNLRTYYIYRQEDAQGNSLRYVADTHRNRYTSRHRFEHLVLFDTVRACCASDALRLYNLQFTAAINA